MEIESVLFDSGKLGKRLMVFGAIHGDEHCGPKAMERIMASIRSGTVRLIAGSVRFVPVCNPEAYARNVRYVEANLNRVFTRSSDPHTYEARCANELCALLDTEADVLLDVHSTSAPGPLSVFIDYPTPEIERFAESLGPNYVLLDWPAVYASNPHGFTSVCTSDYAHSIGIPSVTIECGQHDDPPTVDTAELAILRAMAYAGVTERPHEHFPKPVRVRMKYVEKKIAESDMCTKRWEHLEAIPAGTVIAERADGTRITATEDSIVLLPKHHAKAGEEWFYVGVLA